MKPVFSIPRGVYPTMITPYRNGKIDYGAAAALTEWYVSKGCKGVFAVCQSSEMTFLSLTERVALAKTVVEAAKGKLCVVASGHIADSMDEQIREANAIAETGIDAFVAVSNRFDLHHDGDDEFLRNADAFLKGVDPSIPLGIYECPRPYKRLLTERILDYCVQTKRFVFIKDTCCDPVMLAERLDRLSGTGVGLFNANEQTIYHSLLHGASGYSGIMANFHPELLAWLCENFSRQPEKAAKLSDMLSMIAFTEASTYPCTAKKFLNDHAGIPMDIYSRSADPKLLTPYWELIVRQMHDYQKLIHALLEI